MAPFESSQIPREIAPLHIRVWCSIRSDSPCICTHSHPRFLLLEWANRGQASQCTRPGRKLVPSQHSHDSRPVLFNSRPAATITLKTRRHSRTLRSMDHAQKCNHGGIPGCEHISLAYQKWLIRNKRVYFNLSLCWIVFLDTVLGLRTATVYIRLYGYCTIGPCRLPFYGNHNAGGTDETREHRKPNDMADNVCHQCNVPNGYWSNLINTMWSKCSMITSFFLSTPYSTVHTVIPLNTGAYGTVNQVLTIWYGWVKPPVYP